MLNKDGSRSVLLPGSHFINSSRSSLYIRSVCLRLSVKVGHVWRRSGSSDEPSVRLSGTKCWLLCLKTPGKHKRSVLVSEVTPQRHLPFSSKHSENRSNSTRMRSRRGEYSVRSERGWALARVYFRKDVLVIFVETKADISTLFVCIWN